jgi:hypothetical protein
MTYLINGTMELTTKELEEMLIDHIIENKLYNLKGLSGGTSEEAIIRQVKHHSYRLAREIFGDANVKLLHATSKRGKRYGISDNNYMHDWKIQTMLHIN